MAVKAIAPDHCMPTGLAFWRWMLTIAPSSPLCQNSPGLTVVDDQACLGQRIHAMAPY